MQITKLDTVKTINKTEAPLLRALWFMAGTGKGDFDHIVKHNSSLAFNLYFPSL